ncbi:helix-turn-helix transcriptional regulator [Hymenobacter rubripertinctus]|uniref:XRE family transcriptional regulator n=1 Tax=Hymenobacter rubripertinctus TaxID=2029981 RepID=A0A418R7J0_9BACT|nr:helix-turn-helix transcriptional regulator [Hymenobacter rubripertinctus]RIY13447.1 XRE family transcriptional regulator [Hymenobacter rubripertinctus]
MLDRIRELLAARELSSTQFADTIGVSRPVVSHILSGRNKPSLEVVQKILAAFPDLALPWLLNGEGPMVAPATAPLPPAEPAAPSASTRRPLAPVAAPELVALPVRPPEAHYEPEAVASGDAPAALRTPVPMQAPATAPRVAFPPASGQEAQPAQLSPGAAPAPAAPVKPVGPAPAPPAGAALAQALATPGKHIRRIVIFYQDGTFADYQPETNS